MFSQLQSLPRRFFSWFQESWFVLLCLSLLLFIAFFPKIPLFELIPGYIVRVRLEDVFLAIVLGIFGIQLLRRKVTLSTPITKIFIAYLIVGVLSILSAIFWVKSIPLDTFLHLGKMILHFARRIEYFALFFLFYNAVKSLRHVRMILIGVMIMILGVSAFGFGQKYLYWPVYSTMNREFSKGMRLVLTEHARVPSTFGGHYDMSAFMMFMLIMTLALLFLSRSWKEKTAFVAIFITGFWLLILGSSRSSFLAYLLGTGVLILMVGVYKRSIWWTISRGFIVFTFSIGIMVTLGDLSSRFSQLGIVKQINQQLAMVLKPVTEKPKNVIEVEPLDKTDQLPLPVETTVPVATPVSTASAGTRELPPDVYVNIPDEKTITSTESGKTVTKVVQVPREFTECTYVYGLSACIRFDTLWPRAINGFNRNPLLGSGYSTLTKSSKEVFTEAESTDNDFLRTLGEIGILGVITFYGPIAIFIKRAIGMLDKQPRALVAAVLIGIVSGSIGMFLNGIYIDVFAASKVAFMYWAMIGMGFATLEIAEQKMKEEPQLKKKAKK